MEAAATSSLGREIVRLVQGRQPNQSLEFIGQGFSDALLLRVFTAPVYHAMSQRGESTIPKLAFSHGIKDGSISLGRIDGLAPGFKGYNSSPLASKAFAVGRTPISSTCPDSIRWPSS